MLKLLLILKKIICRLFGYTNLSTNASTEIPEYFTLVFGKLNISSCELCFHVANPGSIQGQAGWGLEQPGSGMWQRSLGLHDL